MNSESSTTEPGNEADRELVVLRVIDAPRDLVFKVWTDPAARWWGPHGFTSTSIAMEFRPDGAWRTCMRSPEGEDFWAHGVYREIEEPERLVFTWAWEEEDGAPGHETLVTVTFIEADGATEISFHQALFDTVAERDSHEQGWNEAFDRLAEQVASERM